jgi:hypothetical protein
VAVAVKGLADLQRAFAKADRDVRLGVREELLSLAEPVRAEAEQRAVTGITNIGPVWSEMRKGATRKVVYAAPRARSSGAKKRPNLAALLMERAMRPALEHNQGRVEHELERVVDRIADQFNRG